MNGHERLGKFLKRNLKEPQQLIASPFLLAAFSLPSPCHLLLLLLGARRSGRPRNGPCGLACACRAARTESERDKSKRATEESETEESQREWWNEEVERSFP